MTVVTIPQMLSEATALPLARYAQILGYNECQFWGVNDGSQLTNCRGIWLLSERLMIARYLREAQIEIEREINYALSTWRWFTEKKREFKCPVEARIGYVIEGGVRAVSNIAIAEAVDHTGDPAIIGPVVTTVVDPDEIHIYHPGTDIEISPSSIVIAGGNVTIEVPRCRMVDIALSDNPETGLDYATVANFEATVDIKRVYNDASTQAVLSTNHRCNALCSTNGCSDFTHAGCIYVRQPEIGSIEVYKASYASGSWLRESSQICCDGYRWVVLNYRAGKEIDEQGEDAIIRLAHSKMPVEPCGCDPIRSLWVRDRNINDVNTRERINCRFGLSDGAWAAWMYATDMKLWRGGII